MHFRHFLIPALMAGAALFLPDNAFAEKSENGQLHSNQETVQASEAVKNPAAQAKNPVKAESAIPIQKAVTAPGQANKGNDNSLPSKVAPKQSASPQTANEAAKTLPEQAKGNGYGLSNTKKADKIINAPGQEKKNTVQENNSGVETGQSHKQDMAEASSDYEAKANVESKKMFSRNQPQEDKTDKKSAVSIKPPSPVPPEKDKAPSSREELPVVDQAPSPPHRSNNNGGTSNDRINTGIGTISMVDKWFDWNKYFEMKLIQPFLTREALLNTQWVNAPPSPPPQGSSFFKNR